MLPNKEIRKKIYIFKIFLIEYGFYKEIVDLYNINCSTHALYDISPVNFFFEVLGKRATFIKYFGKDYQKKIKVMKELNDLWLFEIIYNKDKTSFSYQDRLIAIRTYNLIHRGEMESFKQIINGKEVFSVKQKGISLSVLKTIYNK